MPLPSIVDIARTDLYTQKSELEEKYAIPQVDHILRLRDMVTWCIANPDAKIASSLMRLCNVTA